MQSILSLHASCKTLYHDLNAGVMQAHWRPYCCYTDMDARNLLVSLMSILVMWSMHEGLMTVRVQVSCNQRGRNASQLNIGGTGLGSFNDRFRDAVVGGSPFASPLFQGWVDGLSTASNQYMQDEMSGEEQKELLLQYSDQLRLSMAGNLEDYEMEDHKVLCLHPACRTFVTFCLTNCTKCSIVAYTCLQLGTSRVTCNTGGRSSV